MCAAADDCVLSLFARVGGGCSTDCALPLPAYNCNEGRVADN